jgi:hypothetical protein
MGMGRGKDKPDPRLRRIARMNVARNEVPVMDFQRFMISGLDYKGQISSGYGDHGTGVNAEASLNFGSLFLPGILTLKPEVSLTGVYYKRSMLVLARDASMAHFSADVDLSRKPAPTTAMPQAKPAKPSKKGKKKSKSSTPPVSNTQPLPPVPKPADFKPNWTNPFPISFARLTGKIVSGTAKISGTVSIGVGDATATDEMGLSLGATGGLEAGCVCGTFTDKEVEYYASIKNSRLDSRVEEMLNGQLKKTLALWHRTFLKTANASLQNGWDWAAYMDSQTNAVFDGRAADLADFINDDEKVLKDIHSEGLDGFLEGVERYVPFRVNLGGLISYLRGKADRPPTEDLITALQEWRQGLDTAIKNAVDNLTNLWNNVTAIDKQIEDCKRNAAPQKPPQQEFDELLERRQAAMNALKEPQAQLDVLQLFDTNSTAAIRLLRARRFRKTWRTDDKIKKARSAEQKGHSSLRIFSMQGAAGGKAGAKFNLTANYLQDEAQLYAGAFAEADGQWKRISSTYKTQTAPGKTVGGGAIRPDMRIESRLQTVTLFKSFAISAEMQALASLKSSRGPDPKSLAGEAYWGTMTYKAVLMNFDPDTSGKVPSGTFNPDNPYQYTKKVTVLPNGSGLSRGVSINSDRLYDYIKFCNGSPETARTKKLEKCLLQNLNLDETTGTTTLRSFFKEATVDWVLPGTSLLVEAAFAFTGSPPEIECYVTDDDKIEVPDLFGSELQAIRNNVTLESLRLRLRLVDYQEKDRDIFTLGISKTHIDPDATGTLSHGSAGIGAFRRLRAQHEGSMDLKVQYYGDRDAKGFNGAFETNRPREFSIPPVALFDI